MKKGLAALAVLLALIWGAWLVVVPEDMVVEKAEEALTRDEMSVKLVGFRKGLFYTFTADGVDVLYRGEPVLTMDEVSARPDFLSLLTLKPVFLLRGFVGGGPVSGAVEPGEGSFHVEAKARDVQVGKLGVLERFGVKGRGTASLDFQMKDEKGSARFSVKGAAFEPVSILGLRFPLDEIETVRGAALISYGAVEVESLTMEGPELFARASGTLNRRAVDMQLELMPEADTFPDPTLAQLLAPYKVGRGRYVIPIKAPLGSRP
jgi:type II secretion system protein N